MTPALPAFRLWTPGIHDGAWPVRAGIYAAVFRLRRRRRIAVGRLGTLRFEPGAYVYVGSAQRNLEARLRRHALREKPMRWHIDHLSTRAPMLGALVLEAPKSGECALAAALGRELRVAAPRFGASDCRCPSHLFRMDGVAI